MSVVETRSAGMKNDVNMKVGRIEFSPLTAAAPQALSPNATLVVNSDAAAHNTAEVCRWRERSNEEPTRDRELCLVRPPWYGDMATLMEWCAGDRVFLLEHTDGVRVTHWMPIGPILARADALADKCAAVIVPYRPPVNP